MAAVLDAFLAHARDIPDRAALVLTEPGREEPVQRATFGELNERAERLAAGLAPAGIGEGGRVILAFGPSVDFYALAIALLGSGAEVVLIDGRMDRRRLLAALRSARADAIVAPRALLRRWPLVRPLWRMRRIAADALPAEAPGVPMAAGHPDATAIVSFTSGSTGRAKGVVRTNAVLSGQHEALRRELPYLEGDVDMTCFPAMVLHNLACGVPTVLPPVDLRDPASVRPQEALGVARDLGVTTLAGAPSYVERIVDHMLTTGEPAPRIRRVAVGGAPVTRSLCARVLQAFPQADAVVVYGSTEAEPIAHVPMRDVVGATGEGVLVGAPGPDVEVVLAELPERVDGTLDEVPNEQIGEVVVRGAGVSRDYVGDPEAVATHKVRTRDGALWHRTGDVARRDAQGRLWLLGRVGDVVAHRGRVLHPLAVEADLCALPVVGRAALVAHRRAPEGEVALVAAGSPETALAGVRAHLAERDLADLPVRLVDSIPTDARHASKVDRAALSALLAR